MSTGGFEQAELSPCITLKNQYTLDHFQNNPCPILSNASNPNSPGERRQCQRRHRRSPIDLQEFGRVANQSPAASTAAAGAAKTLTSIALDEFGSEE